MPKVSIIMPVYNAERYLSQALDSIVGQSFADLEVLCIDDGSTDTSSQILHEYKERDSRVRVIHQENTGGSAARNTGIKYATGEYVMFLDSDDIYTSNIVAHAYERAIKTGVDVVLYDFARFVGKPTGLAVKNRTSPDHNINYFTKETYADRFFNDFATITWNKLVKKSVLVDNDLAFDVNLSHNHDVDFSVRLMLAAESYSWLDDLGYYYRSNDNGLTATKRSDPTNVLKILVNLNKLIVSGHKQLKQSFDNYVVDMVVGTLMKYGNDTSKQEEIFNFAYKQVIPSIGLDNKSGDYLFTPLVDIFRLVETGDHDKYVLQNNTLKRRLRAELRKIYDIAQVVLSRFTV